MSDKKKLYDSLNNLKRDSQYKKCMYTAEQIVDMALYEAAKSPELINSLPSSSALLNAKQLQVHNDILHNGRSSAYIQSYYDLNIPAHSLKFEEIQDIYISMVAKKERLKIVQDFIRVYDECEDPDTLTDSLIDQLILANFKKINETRVTELHFFEKNDYGGEFKKAVEYTNAEPLPIGIDYFDTHPKRRFNYPNSLGFILLRTGEGKTFMLLNIARHCLKQNLKVLYIHGEMRKPEIAERFLPMITDGYITKDDIIENNYEKYEKILPQLHEKYQENFIMMGPDRLNGSLRLCDIDLGIRRYKPDVILVDYLQQIVGAEDYMKPVTKKIKGYCDQHNVNVICAVMANEEKDFNTDKRGIPYITDISKCKAFSTDADWILAAKSETSDEYDGIIYTFGVRKGRQGQMRNNEESIPEYVLMPYNGKFDRLENVDPNEVIHNNTINEYDEQNYEEE